MTKGRKLVLNLACLSPQGGDLERKGWQYRNQGCALDGTVLSSHEERPQSDTQQCINLGPVAHAYKSNPQEMEA